LGLQIILAVDPLVKSQTSHRTPNEFNFSDQYLTNMEAFALIPTIDIKSI